MPNLLNIVNILYAIYDINYSHIFLELNTITSNFPRIETLNRPHTHYNHGTSPNGPYFVDNKCQVTL